MDLTGKTIWQVAAGDADRNYADALLDWDVIAMGPGEYGAWPESVPGLRAAKNSERKITTIRRFCEEITEGDIVVLRLKASEVYGVGEVTDKKSMWLDDFGDVDGWDLQFVRRVRWLWKYDKQPKTFPTYDIRYGDTVQKGVSDRLRDWLSHLDVSLNDRNRAIRDLPQSCIDNASIPKIDLQAVGNYLFDKGIASSSIHSLLEQTDELIRIAGWYRRLGVQPSEEETRAFLVVPLLRVLGWTPQKMAPEWNNVDIALFSSLPRSPDNLTVVVEVKKKDNSCLTASGQAQSYAKKFGQRQCRRLIVTDGIRYGVHVKNLNDEFPKTPQAYLNLTRLVPEYPILKCEGAQRCLELMSADWIG